MFEFPTLTGAHEVGSRLYHWIDNTNQRELLVQVWYPSQINEIKCTPYAPDLTNAWKAGLKQSGFPESDIHQIDEIFVHAIPNASLLNDDMCYPVIFFFHGYVAFRTAYTAYCEELASHGYVVITIGHTYYATLTVFPDQRVIHALPEHHQQVKLFEETTSEREQAIWLQDAKFVLEKFREENEFSGSIFYNRLDLNSIGAVGHSFGGSTALQLCRHEARCKAAVNLDGALFGKNATDDIAKPIMIIVGQLSWNEFNKFSDNEIASHTGFPKKLIPVLRQKYKKDIPTFLNNQSSQAEFIVLDGALHAAFSDWVLLKNLPLYQSNKKIFNLESLTGSIDGFKIVSKINTLLVKFFNKLLKR